MPETKLTIPQEVELRMYLNSLVRLLEPQLKQAALEVLVEATPQIIDLVYEKLYELPEHVARVKQLVDERLEASVAHRLNDVVNDLVTDAVAEALSGSTGEKLMRPLADQLDDLVDSKVTEALHEALDERLENHSNELTTTIAEALRSAADELA